MSAPLPVAAAPSTSNQQQPQQQPPQQQQLSAARSRRDDRSHALLPRRREILNSSGGGEVFAAHLRTNNGSFCSKPASSSSSAVVAAARAAVAAVAISSPIIPVPPSSSGSTSVATATAVSAAHRQNHHHHHHVHQHNNIDVIFSARNTLPQQQSHAHRQHPQPHEQHRPTSARDTSTPATDAARGYGSSTGGAGSRSGGGGDGSSSSSGTDEEDTSSASSSSSSENDDDDDEDSSASSSDDDENESSSQRDHDDDSSPKRIAAAAAAVSGGPFRINDQVGANRFQIVSLLGRGAFSHVYLVRRLAKPQQHQQPQQPPTGGTSNNKSSDRPSSSSDQQQNNNNNNSNINQSVDGGELLALKVFRAGRRFDTAAIHEWDTCVALTQALGKNNGFLSAELGFRSRGVHSCILMRAAGPSLLSVLKNMNNMKLQSAPIIVASSATSGNSSSNSGRSGNNNNISSYSNNNKNYDSGHDGDNNSVSNSEASAASASAAAAAGHVAAMLMKKSSSLLVGLPELYLRSIAFQLITTVRHFHNLGIVHTDLKPENVAFLTKNTIMSTIALPVSSAVADWGVSAGSNNNNRKSNNDSALSQLPTVFVRVPLPLHCHITIIDFSNATFRRKDLSEPQIAALPSGFPSHHEDGPSVVGTRHYRAPEVLLGYPRWSFGVDIFALGCILVEMLSGRLLFQTHDDLEHLALMYQILGPAPSYMIQQYAEHAPHFARLMTTTSSSSSLSTTSSFSGAAPATGITSTASNATTAAPSPSAVFAPRWPTRETKQEDIDYVRSQPNLSKICRSFGSCAADAALFMSLVSGMLEWDPRKRFTAEQCLAHPFFQGAA